MKSIKFIQDIEVVVITNIRTNRVESHFETFLKDDVLTEVNIIENNEYTTGIQF